MTEPKGDRIVRTLVRFLLVALAIAVPSAHAWQPAATMSVAREQHAAVLLGDGTVLVVGGDSAASPSSVTYLASAERYEPSRNQWHSAGSMATPRARAMIALLGTGEVLVAGGVNDTGDLATAELYDPVLNSWRPAGALGTARAAGTMLVLNSGVVLAIGGSGLAAPELYNPDANSWRAAAAPVSNVVYSAVLLSSGKVLVRGSAANYFPPFATELYDPGANSWTTVSNTQANTDYDYLLYAMPTGQALLMEDRCCNTLDRYDPVQDTWTPATPSPYNSRSFFAAGVLPYGVLMAGGMETYSGKLLDTAVLYDWAADAWRPLAPMSHSRLNHTATVLQSGDVLVAGGLYDFNSPNGLGPLATAELYVDPIFAGGFE